MAKRKTLRILNNDLDRFQQLELDLADKFQDLLEDLKFEYLDYQGVMSFDDFCVMKRATPKQQSDSDSHARSDVGHKSAVGGRSH